MCTDVLLLRLGAFHLYVYMPLPGVFVVHVHMLACIAYDVFLGTCLIDG